MRLKVYDIFLAPFGVLGGKKVGPGEIDDRCSGELHAVLRKGLSNFIDSEMLVQENERRAQLILIYQYQLECVTHGPFPSPS